MVVCDVPDMTTLADRLPDALRSASSLCCHLRPRARGWRALHRAGSACMAAIMFMARTSMP
jgi:hypothetical protein